MHRYNSMVWPVAFSALLSAAACSQEKVQRPSESGAAGGSSDSKSPAPAKAKANQDASPSPCVGASCASATGVAAGAAPAAIAAAGTPAVTPAAATGAAAPASGFTATAGATGSPATSAQILPGIPSILGVSGSSLEQCTAQGLAWVPRTVGLTGGTVNGSCGEPLVKWCCTEADVLAQFPDAAASLQSTFSSFKARGMRLYHCGTSGGTYNFYFFMVNNSGAHIASTYVDNTTPARDAPAAASCPVVKSTDLGLLAR